MPTHKLVLYNPHELQKKFHESRARYRVAATGRQSGKSTMCLNELVKRAWENPGQTFWFVSPTFDQAKIQYRRLVGMLWSCREILMKKNQTELRVKFSNLSQIRFVSGEVGQNLRGETLHGVVIDEYREQPEDLWRMIVRPMLTTTKGWAAFVSTPNGFDSFYDLFEQAREGDKETWDYFQAPSTANPLFTVEEFERAKKEMGQGEFKQEILAEFVNIHQGSAYVCYGEHNYRDTSPFTRDGSLVSPHLPLLVALDFNLSPMAWTIGQTHGGRFFFFDEVWLKSTHTQEAARELIARVKDHPSGVILCGDATSKAGQRAAAGKSDYAILEEMLSTHGVKYENRTPESNPLVKDRVNVLNAHMRAADGTVRLWVYPQGCPALHRDLQRVSWKQGATVILDQTTDPMLTHSSDGVGYAVYALSDLWAPSPGVTRVVYRKG